MATTGYQAALDTNDLIMSYIAEDTWGTTPVASPAMKKIRLDAEGFSGSKTRNRPNEINPTGQSSAAITTKEESTGSLNFSVSAGTHNDLIAASLGSVFTAPVSYAGTDVSISAADANARTCTLLATAGAFTTTNLIVKGQMIKLFAADDTSQCGVARILTVAAAQLTLDMCTWVPAITAAGPMGACTIKASMLRNGTTVQMFTFLKQLTALMNLRYPGSFPTGGSLDVGTGDYLKGTLAFLNKDEISANDMSFFTTPTFTAAPNGTVIDSIKGIGPVWRGVDTGSTPGVPALIDGVVQKMGVKWNKEGAAAQYGMGSAAAVGMRPGKQLISGSMSTYFKEFTLYLQYKNEQAGPISFYALDDRATLGPKGELPVAGAKGYVITYCNANIMNPKVVCGGPGQDVMADFDIEGQPDISSTQIYGGRTLQIDYFA
jgi:Phage tail tube protein